MKTSKRLLSILLMLTMLLSMFTVMASADDPEDLCMHVDEEFNTTFTIFHAAATATCFQEGHVAYYECKMCPAEAIYDESSGKFVVQTNGVTKAKDPTNHGGKLPKTPAQEPTCGASGNYEYYYCSGCNKYFKDEDGKNPFNGDVVRPATGKHTLEPVAAKDPTCTKDGYEAYWVCSGCKQKFSDAEGKIKIDAPKVIEATGHKIVPVRGNPATCTDKGVKDHYECARTGCGALFEDEAGTKPLTDKDVEISATGHDLEHVAAKEPTKTATGNIEYWHCKRCDKYFSDKDATAEIRKEDTVIPQLKEEKYTLTIAVEKVNGAVPGEVQYAGKPYEMLEGLQKGETRELTAVAKSGYQFKEWKINDASVSDSKKATTTVTMDDTDATITAVFEKTATPARYKLEIDRNNTKGSIEYRTWFGNKWSRWYTIEKNEYPLAIQGLQKGDKIQIKAYPDSGCVATWMIDRVIETVKDNTYTVTIDDADVSVYVMFQKKISSDRELDLDISGWKHGEIKYRVNNGTKYTLKSSDYPFTLEEGDKITFYIDADSGYTAKWNLDKESKSYSDEFTVRYKDIDEDGSTLHISFVKKSTIVDNDYPTLTFDITGGKHGTVYRGTREYEHGDVISIKKNDKMTFKAKADKGYVAVWTYKGDTYVGDEYTVKMGANDAKLYVEFMDKDDIRLTELPFRDVSKRDWYYDDVVYVYRKGYMDGMSSTRFGGELNTTRGQIVTILWRLTGEPRATKRNPFTDVSSSQYYYDAISWAYDAGVVDGFDARTFKPDQNVTREQLAAILYRYAKYMNLSTSGSAYLAKYRDADKIANWAYDAMAWANYRGLINGTSATRIDPKGYATRAQIAAILHRFAVEYGA
jgi:hypothetical protein